MSAELLDWFNEMEWTEERELALADLWSHVGALWALRDRAGAEVSLHTVMRVQGEADTYLRMWARSRGLAFTSPEDRADALVELRLIVAERIEQRLQTGGTVS